MKLVTCFYSVPSSSCVPHLVLLRLAISCTWTMMAGHNRPISTMCMCGEKLLSGSYEDATNTTLGVVRSWDISTGLCTTFAGPDGSQKASANFLCTCIHRHCFVSLCAHALAAPVKARSVHPLHVTSCWCPGRYSVLSVHCTPMHFDSPGRHVACNREATLPC